ncbi:hypothetical protein B0T14DRAFT_577471 [Immersiella caudata]|uniref:Myb-like DNA-binding domain-containing protein n=1 Tax=Immersiella caudata TaxID=314043 RepID=A0AA40C5W0_9PEZI|nr:hypothetical protein B0T14DRAFT_577471 [Immersiella caudata]
MAPLDVDSQFKFLLACVKHSVAGKPNFQAVAEELDIVSKAAAAKRYERLLKAHDITPTPATPKKADGGDGTAKTPKTPASRKRKTPAKVEKDDDDNSFKGESGEEEKKPRVKREKKVKKEEDDNSATVSALQDGASNAMMRGQKVKMCDIPWATEEVLAAARRGGSGNDAITVDDDDGEVLVVGSSSLSEPNGGDGSGGICHTTAATALPPTSMVTSTDQNHGDAAAHMRRQTVSGVGANDGFAMQSRMMRLPFERSHSYFQGGPPLMGRHHGI